MRCCAKCMHDACFGLLNCECIHALPARSCAHTSDPLPFRHSVRLQHYSLAVCMFTTLTTHGVHVRLRTQPSNSDASAMADGLVAMAKALQATDEYLMNLRRLDPQAFTKVGEPPCPSIHTHTHPCSAPPPHLPLVVRYCVAQAPSQVHKACPNMLCVQVSQPNITLSTAPPPGPAPSAPAPPPKVRTGPVLYVVYVYLLNRCLGRHMAGSLSDLGRVLSTSLLS